MTRLLILLAGLTALLLSGCDQHSNAVAASAAYYRAPDGDDANPGPEPAFVTDLLVRQPPALAEPGRASPSAIRSSAAASCASPTGSTTRRSRAG
jgi:hypothetical protein